MNQNSNLNRSLVGKNLRYGNRQYYQNCKFNHLYLLLCAILFSLMVSMITYFRLSDHSSKHYLDDRYELKLRNNRYRQIRQSYYVVENNSSLSSDYIDSQYWIIFGNRGLVVRYSYELDSPVINVLPAGAIVIGRTIVTLNQLTGNTTRLLLDFPVKGWVTITNSKYNYPNLKLLIMSRHIINGNSMINKQIQKNYSSCKEKSFLIDTDYHGGDFDEGPAHVPSPIKCCELCVDNNECGAWTFTDSNECWLKQISKGKIMKGKVGLISGKLSERKLLSTNNNNIKNKNGNNGNKNGYTNVECCNKSNQLNLNKRFHQNITTNDENFIINSFGEVNEYYTISFENRYDDIKDSPFRMTLPRTDTSWDKQWPIGNGNMGVLVGGTFTGEIIPMSIAGFFLSKNSHDPHDLVIDNDNEQDLSIINNIKSPFFQSRDYFLKGKFELAQKSFEKLTKNSIGMFQYFSDIILVFNEVPFLYQNKKINNKYSTIDIQNIPPHIRKLYPNANRDYMINYIHQIFQPTNKSQLANNDNIYKTIISEGILDTYHGMSHSTHIQTITNIQSKESDLLYHHREWFASEIDDLIIDNDIVLINDIVPYELTKGQRSVWLDQLMNKENDSEFMSNAVIPELQAFHIQIVLKSTHLSTIPLTIMQGLDTGITSLRQNHIELFSNRMKRLDVNIQSSSLATSSTYSSSEEEICYKNLLIDRLESFSNGCIDYSNSKIHHKIEPFIINNNIIDSNLINKYFQYGRYLLLSSSSQSVANLQGPWADGPSSVWNGDYHMNINMQQIYWAADVARMEETIPPLLDFIDEIHEKGLILF
eukprot:gene11083-14878_t